MARHICPFASLARLFLYMMKLMMTFATTTIVNGVVFLLR